MALQPKSITRGVTFATGSSYHPADFHNFLENANIQIEVANSSDATALDPSAVFARTATAAAAADLTTHTSNTSNPHGVTKAQVGLGNCDNTADAAKPVSTAQAAAIAAAVAPLAPLASPALTGNPTAPTQSRGNNSTRLATTAFVQQDKALYPRAKTSGFTAVVGEAYKCTGTFTVTIPASSEETSYPGIQILIQNAGTGIITIARSLSDTLGRETSITLRPGESVSLMNAGGGFWFIY
jgi:hypothetical protein